jgi:hypothetical protein
MYMLSRAVCYNALNKMKPSFLSELINYVAGVRHLRLIIQELLEALFVSSMMRCRAPRI